MAARRMTLGAVVFWVGCALLFLAGRPLAHTAPTTVHPRQPGLARPAGSAASTYRALLDRYCVTCHNTTLRTANLPLDTIDIEQLASDAAVWEKVAQKLRAGAMPPPRRPRPEPETAAAFASWLEAGLDRVAATRPNPGRPALHRLNRAEYTNAIRDLLSVEIDERSLLPADDMAFGFDNIADALALSPALLDRYLIAARKISRLAVGDVSLRPEVESYRVSKHLMQDDRMSEDLPFGTHGGLAVRHIFPVDGDYILSVRFLRNRPLPSEPLDVRVDGERVAFVRLEGDATEPSWPVTYDAASGTLDVRASVAAGSRLVGITFAKSAAAPEGLAPVHLPVGNISFRQSGVAGVDIRGPYDVRGAGDSASRRRVFVCQPASVNDEAPCAREILQVLARRAYRRPVSEKDVEPLLAIFEDGRRAAGFDVGIRRAIERVLVDPEFLFRVERDPADVAPGTAYRLTDLELASRLSFFLWSSIPDDELIELAATERLGEPAVLRQQVRRMLADDRATALVKNFVAQWLHLRNMRGVTPDIRAFPEFDDNLREAFVRETELLIWSQIDADRSVVELLTAGYTFVNERLARHYGMPRVYGSQFRRVPVADEARRGLLGHGSILTVTSYATRTSPVVRGKWLLENILGAPPPPPPPDVPELEERGEAETPRSIRERMEQHRANPVCASCHARMDPLGFALENFDAIGKWRATEHGVPIDASGTLPDGTAFDGPAELGRLLVGRGDEFVATVTSKLLTYALGRGLEYSDRPAVRAIIREAVAANYRWSAIIGGIVESTPFRMRIRRAEP